jgi:hypothetical protein
LYRVSVPGWLDGVVGDDCLVGTAGRIRGSAMLSAWKLTCLYVLSSLRFSWAIDTKDEYASVADTREHGRGLSSVQCLARRHMDM